MTKEEQLVYQKQISQKMISLIVKGVGCSRSVEKLAALNLALDSLNRAAFYLRLELASEVEAQESSK